MLSRPFSPRERQVMTLLSQGHTIRSIAGVLGCKPSTVQAHIRHAMRKLNTRSREEAVAMWLRSHGDAAPASPSSILPRVLVIEPDETIRTAIGGAVTLEGWAADLADTEAEGLRLARARCPDLVLMDISLSQFEHAATIAQLRDQCGGGLPIVALSTWPNEALARHLGAVGFLAKPFDLDDLIALLVRVHPLD